MVHESYWNYINLKFLKKFYCQRNIQPSFENPCDCLNPKIIPKIPNLHKQRVILEAGQFCNAHSNTVIKDNE